MSVPSDGRLPVSLLNVCVCVFFVCVSLCYYMPKGCQLLHQAQL